LTPVIDEGQGPPLVLIPGIQGRWEYLRPAIDALARSFRVLTFPLSGEPGCALPLDASAGLDRDAGQVLALLDRAGIERAVVCGISFGGLPAIRFAATHPDRSAALILASTPGPLWRLRRRHRLYARAPRIFGPAFMVESPFRLRRELAAAFPGAGDRWRFVRWQLRTLARAPLSPARMAARARIMVRATVADDCARVTAPTLVITGERALDRVVPVDTTLGYVRLIAGADCRTLARTGHLGSITTPDAFANVVREFTERQTPAAHGWNRATA
jgi:pimeloyl-ACP methyl ester carboxylesterase